MMRWVAPLESAQTGHKPSGGEFDSPREIFPDSCGVNTDHRQEYKLLYSYPPGSSGPSPGVAMEAAAIAKLALIK